MANYCEYEVLVRGSKNAAKMVYESMPVMDYKEIDKEYQRGGRYTIRFSGNCKWSVNYGVSDDIGEVDVDSMTEEEIEENGDKYWEYSLGSKSKALACEIQVHYWSEESEFDQFDHYVNGKCVKQRKIAYDDSNKFDWRKTEFVGHEGEYDESVDGEESDRDLMSFLNGTLGQVAEMPFCDSAIGDTGFDMIKWTFTEGKTVKGKEWEIAIPDGFVKIESKEGREFELVPQGYEKEEIIPIHILPGNKNDVGLKDRWLSHPNTRKALAEVIAVKMSELMASLLGSTAIITSVGEGNICACLMIQNTFANSYSYQFTVYTDKASYLIRIQTQGISDEQKFELEKSAKEWIKTLKYDDSVNPEARTYEFDEDAIIADIKNRSTSLLDEAIKTVLVDYALCVNSRTDTLKFMGKYGMLDEHTPDRITEMMNDGLEIKLYYSEKLNNIVKRLPEIGADKEVLKQCFALLARLDNNLMTFKLDDKPITVEEPERLVEIKKAWKELESNL